MPRPLHAIRPNSWPSGVAPWQALRSGGEADVIGHPAHEIEEAELVDGAFEVAGVLG